MSGEHLVDLDELILRCRDNQAKLYIAESVACYRAGAFRAAIVSTWTAVLYDIIAKLAELASDGDGRAADLLKEFEDARDSKSYSKALKFEDTVLDTVATEMELLSVLELDDFKQLKLHRNRCAHPTTSVSGEPYQPPAELARFHIRNAVTHLLQHAPVQGRAALTQILTDVQSDLFPVDPDRALKRLRNGPLSRPRTSLLRNAVVAFLKEALYGGTEDTRARSMAALQAVKHMHFADADKVLREELPKRLHRVDDTQLGNIVEFFRAHPEAADEIDESVLDRLAEYFRRMPFSIVSGVLTSALAVPTLAPSARTRIAMLDQAELTTLISDAPGLELVERALELYRDAGSFAFANAIGSEIILPLVPYFRPEHAREVVQIAAGNGQVASSYQLSDVFRALEQTSIISGELLQDELLAVALQGDTQRENVAYRLDASHTNRLFAAIVDQAQSAEDASTELELLYHSLRRISSVSDNELKALWEHYDPATGEAF